LACGLPILTEDIAYNRNTIRNAGLFFETGNAISLAKKIREMFEHKEELSDMQLAARIRVEEELNWEMAAQKFIAIYEKAMRSRKLA
jgi:glycosyltransferase involved in cell wall biosynthesis